MDFKTEKPIYQQIADIICERIASGEWAVEERIPSVRELAAELEVNPNTAMRAYDKLQSSDILTNQRGIGYFVAPGAQKTVVAVQKAEFFEQTLPELFRTMRRLGIGLEDVEKSWKEYQPEEN